MEYGTEFFISLFLLSLVLVLLHSIFIRYLTRLLNRVAMICKEHFKSVEKDVKSGGKKVEPIHDMLDDSESESEDKDDFKGILITEDEVNLELHAPACRFYHSKYLHPGQKKGETGGKEDEGAKDPLDDRKQKPALLEGATSENEEGCKCKPKARFCVMTLIQTPPKSYTDSL